MTEGLVRWDIARSVRSRCHRTYDSAITLSEQQELGVFSSLEAEFKGVHSIVSVIAEQRRQSR